MNSFVVYVGKFKLVLSNDSSHTVGVGIIIWLSHLDQCTTHMPIRHVHLRKEKAEVIHYFFDFNEIPFSVKP